MYKIVQKTFINAYVSDAEDKNVSNLIDTTVSVVGDSKVEALERFRKDIKPAVYEQVFTTDEPVLLGSEDFYLRNYDRDITIDRFTEYGDSVKVKVYIVQEYWLEQFDNEE